MDFCDNKRIIEFLKSLFDIRPMVIHSQKYHKTNLKRFIKYIKEIYGSENSLTGNTHLKKSNCGELLKNLYNDNMSNSTENGVGSNNLW